MSEVYALHVEELEAMKKYPKALYTKGNTSLLLEDKIAIVGSRKPSQYTKEMTFILSQKLANAGVCIVSGAAMGVDAIAHRAAKNRTIAVMANGLDIIYPKVNRALIEDIYTHALALSSYEDGTAATKYSFVNRNEIVVALSKCLVVTQADLKSGSMHSVNFALKMGKKVYVLPQRIGESEGTNALLKENKATIISDIDSFVNEMSLSTCKVSNSDDELLEFCKKESSYEVVVSKFGPKVFEYELEGKISIENSRVIVL